ncbi:MAG: AgmX/PglI C-terminal domain-containing protein [Bacteriovoracaceae bacterium]|nr:AgmX/PglI C-terminal domain-containing protein [Bacteriovoracaceae bacterium]
MIVTKEDTGQLVKVLSNFHQGMYGFHHMFGLISSRESKKRHDSRKRRGYMDREDRWDCQFEVVRQNKEISIKALNNCEVHRNQEQNWKLVTPKGNFIFNLDTPDSVIPHFADEDEDLKQDDMAKGFLSSALFVLFLFIGLWWAAQNIEEVAKVVKPITVKMVEMKHEIVRIAAPKVVQKKVLTKKQKSHRAIKQNLGFLGLVGKKSLKKAVGGTPMKLKKVTAGAGKGGDAGSGGELLVGLGKAVKRTTVGNTGTKGLGGIGTKGAGGGAGGYGTTTIASGEGVGISAVAISNDVTLEGGLSRAVIMATIQKYLAQIKACYNQGLKTNPALEGTVAMDFQILATGGVGYARVGKSSLGSKMVEGCMSRKMLTWQFPRPRGGVSQDVRFPFSLRPESI